MKVLYIVKTQLHYYPPCISQIRMLKDLAMMWKCYMEHRMRVH